MLHLIYIFKKFDGNNFFSEFGNRKLTTSIIVEFRVEINWIR